MVLAPAIAFLAADGMARGFGPWEKTALAALWLVPLVARTVPQVTLIPLGVPVMLAMFVLILRRAERGAMAEISREDRSTFRTDSPTMSPGPGGTSRGQDFARP